MKPLVYLSLIALLLSSCVCCTPRIWHGDNDIYGAVTSKVEGNEQLLSLDFSSGPSGEKLYLTLYALPVYQEQFSYKISGEEHEGALTSLKGGQRLLVHETDRLRIRQALEKGHAVEISLAMYHETFEATGFNDALAVTL